MLTDQKHPEGEDGRKTRPTEAGGEHVFPHKVSCQPQPCPGHQCEAELLPGLTPEATWNVSVGVRSASHLPWSGRVHAEHVCLLLLGSAQHIVLKRVRSGTYALLADRPKRDTATSRRGSARWRRSWRRRIKSCSGCVSGRLSPGQGSGKGASPVCSPSLDASPLLMPVTCTELVAPSASCLPIGVSATQYVSVGPRARSWCS